MTERFRELAKQARMEWIQFEQVDKNVQAPGIYYHENVVSRFAELIVRECAEVAHCNFHVDGLTLGGIMKKHFGIEDKNT